MKTFIPLQQIAAVLWGWKSVDDRQVGTIKSIQRGTITIAADGGISGSGELKSGTATITAVDTSKAVLIPLGTTPASADTNYQEARLALTNGTTVTASRYHFSGTPNTTVGFQVVEYY